jgi:hypothetical protein
MVILLSKLTLSLFKDSQLPKSGILAVITGSFVKLLTPDAKKRYATIGNTKEQKNIFFFIRAAVIFSKIKKKGTQCVLFFELIFC